MKQETKKDYKYSIKIVWRDEQRRQTVDDIGLEKKEKYRENGRKEDGDISICN